MTRLISEEALFEGDTFTSLLFLQLVGYTNHDSSTPVARGGHTTLNNLLVIMWLGNDFGTVVKPPNDNYICLVE